MPPHLKGLAITTAGVLVLSPDSLLVRLIETDPWTLLFWRGVLMAISLTVVVALYHRSRLPAAFRAIGWHGALSATMFGVSSMFFVLALTHTLVANVLVIIAASPLFAALFARLFLKERVAPRTAVAIATAIAGIAVLVFGSMAGKGGGTLFGDMCALGSATLIAGHFTVLRAAGDRADMTPSVALSGVIAALIAIPFATPTAVDAADVGYLLLLGLVVLPVAFGLIAIGPRYLPAPEVGLLMLLETVLGPIWVWLAVGEEPGAYAFVGGAIVIATLALHSLAGLARHRRRAAVDAG